MANFTTSLLVKKAAINLLENKINKVSINFHISELNKKYHKFIYLYLLRNQVHVKIKITGVKCWLSTLKSTFSCSLYNLKLPNQMRFKGQIIIITTQCVKRYNKVTTPKVVVSCRNISLRSTYSCLLLTITLQRKIILTVLNIVY